MLWRVATPGGGRPEQQLSRQSRTSFPFDLFPFAFILCFFVLFQPCCSHALEFRRRLGMSSTILYCTELALFRSVKAMKNWKQRIQQILLNHRVVSYSMTKLSTCLRSCMEWSTWWSVWVWLVGWLQIGCQTLFVFLSWLFFSFLLGWTPLKEPAFVSYYYNFNQLS